MDFEDGFEIILTAFEKRNEERAFRLYAAQYPWMPKDNFVPFDQFYKPRRFDPPDEKTEGEILSEVKQILDAMRG